MSKKLLLLVSFFCIIFSIAASKAQEPSLYSRLGGVYSIAAVIDDFVDKLLSDPIVTANQNVISAMNRINKPGLKYLLTEMICEATGGPQKYTGRKMKEAHQGLNISETEWQATVKDLISSLNKFNVPEKEQTELLAIVASTKSDIVAATPEASPIASPEKAPEATPQASPIASPEAPKPEASPSPSSKTIDKIAPVLNELLKAPTGTDSKFPQIPAIPEIPRPKQIAPVMPYIPRMINPDELELPDFAE